MNSFWEGLSRAARAGLLSGVALIVLVAALVAWWLVRADFQVMFSDLKPQDAQAMTAELDRLKIPYQIGESGSAILVDRPLVHSTRLKLMGKELPLNGAVGFELFNNTDFGMTEFAQKINYQRALQGELVRTIQSLAEVRDVRVLLALPEQGLFKQSASMAKASVTLTMRPGQSLRPEQIAGIQRLVAAAVPGMTVHGVTIVDRQGVALTRQGSDGETEPSGARLELKRETEAYLVRKVAAVLDRTFGPGQAIATVDATLNMDSVRTTTEDVLSAPARSGAHVSGVVVKERETARDGSGPLDGKVAADAGRGGSLQRDVEYAVGRRVEQVVSQPGAVRRVHVVAVVMKTLNTEQEQQLRKLVAAAVGASVERGDTVVVQTLATLGATGGVRPAADLSLADSAGTGPDGGSVSDRDGLPADAATLKHPLGIGLVLAALAGLAVVLVFAMRRSRLAIGEKEHADAVPLSPAERQTALRRVQDWMQEISPRPGAPSGEQVPNIPGMVPAPRKASHV